MADQQDGSRLRRKLDVGHVVGAVSWFQQEKFNMVIGIPCGSSEQELWAWAGTVEIALMHGWRPRGVPPGEIDFSSGIDDWDCPSIFGDSRKIPDNELRSLGEALHRALKAHSEPSSGHAPPPPCSCGEPLDYSPLSAHREYLTLFADFCLADGQRIP